MAESTMLQRDELQLYVACTRDFGDPSACEEFLDVVERFGKGWMPVRFGPHEPLRLKYRPGSRSEIIETWMTPPKDGTAGGDLLFRTDRPVGARGWVYWRRHPRHDVNFVSITVPAASATHELEGVLLRLGLDLLSVLGGVYAHVAATPDVDAQNKRITATGGYQYLGQRLGSSLPGIYWANLFGNELVRLIGVDRLSGAPATKKTVTPDGHWIIWSGEHAGDFRQAEVAKQREAIREALGSDLIFDLTQPERSTKPIPFDRSAILGS